MRVYIRYDTPDEKGNVRRDAYEAMDPPQYVPDLAIPPAGTYLWDWYHQLSNQLTRVSRGVCVPIGWLDFEAWARVTDTLVRPPEFAVLVAMDVAFCSEMNKELQAFHERSRDRYSADMETARRGK